ncbi:hypothetical protein E4O03_04465 [Treponema sp. OMZ 792]|uniref:hypothetical protein n=1 Tax=unclassified Treponema TaxID=2638727 RepID=UPI0020A54ADD|nr:MULTISPECIES: hypothetical protein [unclassified Treponema]UTC75970.1 hypothetical protein E4O03_04465 [Treponema sp. OMZ 792]UTC79970.1 hypothetical protein E4O07_04485 [Treponema sp. OMZ 798]
MQTRITKYIFILIISLVLISCEGRSVLYGRWKSEERDLIIRKNTFELVFHKSDTIMCLQGSIDIKSRYFIMKFEKYVTQDGVVSDLQGSELYGHTEKVTYKVNKEYLETYIDNTGKTYRYKRYTNE